MVIIENINLTAMVEFLNMEFKEKENGNPFNVQDCQHYIRRGYLPKYLGEYSIENMEYKYAKLYKIVKNEV